MITPETTPDFSHVVCYLSTLMTPDDPIRQVMDRVKFEAAVFEIADLWTATVDADECARSC